MPKMHISTPWIGSGVIKAQLDGQRLLLRIPQITTRGGKIQRLVRDFFRADLQRLRPQFGAMAVAIRIETTPHPGLRIDVDNIAKAALDSLTGAVYHDDSQVQKLYVERHSAAQDCVYILAEPLPAADDPPPDLENFLARLPFIFSHAP